MNLRTAILDLEETCHAALRSKPNALSLKGSPMSIDPIINGTKLCQDLCSRMTLGDAMLTLTYALGTTITMADDNAKALPDIQLLLAEVCALGNQFQGQQS